MTEKNAADIQALATAAGMHTVRRFRLRTMPYGWSVQLQGYVDVAPMTYHSKPVATEAIHRFLRQQWEREHR